MTGNETKALIHHSQAVFFLFCFEIAFSDTLLYLRLNYKSPTSLPITSDAQNLHYFGLAEAKKMPPENACSQAWIIAGKTFNSANFILTSLFG